MKPRQAIGLLLAAIAAVLVLFDVDPAFDVALPREREIPDPEIEAAFDQCFAARDEEIHRTAFGTIDNPDVQREFISANRARARRECRARNPERMIRVEEPLHFNLIDLHPRFW